MNRFQSLIDWSCRRTSPRRKPGPRQPSLAWAPTFVGETNHRSFSIFLLVTVLHFVSFPVYASKGDPLAGTVVRSKEYVVRRSPHKVEEFIGDVYYRSGDRQIRSDWAEFDHQSQLWKLRGHIDGLLRLKDGTLVQLWGEQAEHSEKTGRGWLREKDAEHPVRFEHGEGSDIDRGTAERLEWDEKASRAWAKGNVHVWGERGEAEAEVAEYHHDERLLTLTGRRPVIIHHEPKWSGALQADHVRALEGERRLQGDGRVQGWIVFENLRESGLKP